MPLSCQCPSCNARFKAPEKLAGKNVKCPKCGGALRVPDAVTGTAGVSDAPVGRPHVSASESATALGHKAVLKTRKAAEPPTAAEPQVAIPLSPAAAVPQIDTASESDSSISSRISRRGRKNNKMPNRATLAIVGGAAALLVVVAIFAWLFSGPANKNSRTASRRTSRPTVPFDDAFSAASARASVSTTIDATGKDQSAFVLSVSQGDRSNIRVDIDGQQKSVPASGEVTFPLSPGQHHVVIRRRGYEQVDYRMYLRPAETCRFTPRWTKNAFAEAFAAASNQPTTDDWLQDFNAAKVKAAEAKKDLLVVFTGSDWCGYSQRLTAEVLLQTDFRQLVDDKFVLVYLDFPRGAVSRSKVKNLQQNQKLSQKFHIRGFPTIIVTDSQGRPYGVLGYQPGGVAVFQQQLESARGVRDERDRLFAKVESSEGPAALSAAIEALKVIEESEVASFYGETLRGWYDLALQHDPKNAQGLNEQIFEANWKAQLVQLEEEDTAGIAKLLQQFDQWCQQRRFQDPDRAARLHLQAAWIAKDEHPELVAKYAAEGLAYGPKNEELHELLSQVKRAASQIGVLGSGSGFLVAEGGYILTNHHVVEGPGRLVVRLPGQAQPAPASVIAQDARRDLAVIKVELPQELKLQPLDFSLRHVDRGTRVAAFGYPLGDTVGKGLKLTTGIVSATDQQSDDRTLLLDCRVNPGNSGGPLCNASGRVVGVVAAKSGASSEIDSYGMAISAEDAVLFLKQHLPTFAQPGDDDEAELAEWSDVDRRVSPSVLMILKMK